VVDSLNPLLVKDDLRVVERILESKMPLKFQCQAIWHLIHGMPHFYFETQFKTEDDIKEWPEEFVIITAFATTGKQWSEAQNAAADRALLEELGAPDRLIGRVTGYSLETLHAEPGWAAVMPWREACMLGLKYKQDAIYVVRDDQLFVTFCGDRRQLVPVGDFRERLNPPKQ
jgi:hypothetical protein